MADEDCNRATREAVGLGRIKGINGRVWPRPQTGQAVELSGLTDAALLAKLVGARESRRCYQGRLEQLFAPTDSVERPPEICSVAKELIKRWLAEELEEKSVFSQPSAIRDYLRIHFAGQEFESFVGLFLDAQNRLIGAIEFFRGTLTQTSVYPREIVKAALRQNAASVVFSHNHPSGNAEPSHADRNLTRALADALALVDVKVLDHFIVGGTRTMSFAERGML